MRNLEEDYRGWPLRQRLELLAFDAWLAGAPQALSREPVTALIGEHSSSESLR
jgi:hypothetical protein